MPSNVGPLICEDLQASCLPIVRRQAIPRTPVGRARFGGVAESLVAAAQDRTSLFASSPAREHKTKSDPHSPGFSPGDVTLGGPS